jgi:hypothetical protein
MEQLKGMECGSWKASSDVLKPHNIYIYEQSNVSKCHNNVKKVKVQFSLQQATKAQRVSRGIALPFHDLGT